jgi:hypothetical protein
VHQGGGDAAERAIRIEGREVLLDITAEPGAVRSRSEIRFGCLEPGAGTFAEIDATGSRTRESRPAARVDVDRVDVDGVDVVGRVSRVPHSREDSRCPLPTMTPSWSFSF